MEQQSELQLHASMNLEGESSDLGAVVASAVAVEAVVVASSTFTSRLLQLVKEVSVLRRIAVCVIVCVAAE